MPAVELRGEPLHAATLELVEAVRSQGEGHGHALAHVAHVDLVLDHDLGLGHPVRLEQAPGLCWKGEMAEIVLSVVAIKRRLVFESPHSPPAFILTSPVSRLVRGYIIVVFGWLEFWPCCRVP